MAGVSYGLCFVTACACAVLLTRAYRTTRSRLLYWSAMCFWGLSLTNALVFIDLVDCPRSGSLLGEARDGAGLGQRTAGTEWSGSLSRMAAHLAPFLLGAMALASLVVALFFARFHRATGDRLFLYFAGAFALEAVNRTLLAFAPSANESAPEYYLLRALGYSLIVLGIYRKNRT